MKIPRFRYLKTALTSTGLVYLLFSASFSFAGDLEPPADIDNATSAMYSINDIYNRLDTGSAGTVPTGEFTEPTEAPGATGHTLNEVMQKAPAVNAYAAKESQVAKGKKYWSLEDGNWGEKTGNLVGGVSTAGGTFSLLGRWCDNGDGTVTDTTSGLIWFKRGDYIESFDAMKSSMITANMSNGYPADLSDGSSRFDWRQPTANELLSITSGVEAISPASQYFFTGIQPGNYWTCNDCPVSGIGLRNVMVVQMPETIGVPIDMFWSTLCNTLPVRSPR